jgi:uncharacterized membrane protein YhaH (DUF805 family)
MGFSDAIRTSFSQYATFAGRASRPEYWYFFLFLFLGSLVTGIADAILFHNLPEIDESTPAFEFEPHETPLSSLFYVVTVLPHLAVAWRRMHDTGRSGYMALLPMLLSAAALGVFVLGIGAADFFAGGLMDRILTGITLTILVPLVALLIISPLLVFWWLIRPSQPSSNLYGPNPHEVTT